MSIATTVRRWSRRIWRGVSGYSDSILVLLLISVVLNLAGFVFHLFQPVFLYDEVAHFLTPFALIAFAAEAAYRRGEVFFGSGARALMVGAVVGFVGASAWELVEILIDALSSVTIIHPPLDTVSDVLLGTLGGALGVWRTSKHFVSRRSRRSRS